MIFLAGMCLLPIAMIAFLLIMEWLDKHRK